MRSWRSIFSMVVIATTAGLAWTATATAQTELKITASDAAPVDLFGYSVAINNGQAVVGAYQDDHNEIANTGAAYVFTNAENGWIQAAKLTANDAAPDDLFGYSVAIYDGIAIIGAHLDDDGGENAGSAYVFTNTENGWIQTAKLTANDAAPDDLFGYSVAIYNRTVIVGAFQDDDGGAASGSAYVFTNTENGWIQTTKLAASDAVVNDRFGFAVSLSQGDAIVGAVGTNDGGANSGSAYVFTNTENGWIQAAKLTADDAGPADLFGQAVAIDNGTAVVGAYQDDHGWNNSGSAYVFTNTENGWIQTAKLTANDAATEDLFGQSVNLENGTAIIGAIRDDDGGQRSGSVYVFTDTQEGWIQTTKLTASDAAADDLFGQSVGIDNGTIIVGAFQDDDDGQQSGSAYLYNIAMPSIIAPSLLTFGTVPLSGPANVDDGLIGNIAWELEYVKIKNAGAGLLSVTTVAVIGSPSFNYSDIINPASFSLASGDSINLAVVMSSAIPGRKDATLVLNHNDNSVGGQTLIPLHALVHEYRIGLVRAWGQNEFGQTDVPFDLDNVVSIDGGWRHNLALTSDSTVVSWGWNEYGQANVPNDLTDVRAVSGSGFASLALKHDGTIVGWGLEGYADVPVGLENVVAISAGTYHALALKSNGTVVTWYENNNTVADFVPDNLDSVIAIAAGNNHNIALKLDGSVVAWGANTYGQTNVPEGLNNVAAIAVGAYHVLALKTNGTVVGWKPNFGYDQGTVPDGLEGVVAIASGVQSHHSLILTSEGITMAWGRNDDGQITIPDDLMEVLAISSGSDHSLALVNVPADVPPESVKLNIRTVFGAPGDTLSIPVTLANPNTGRPVAGAQFDLVTEQPAWRTFTGAQDLPNGFSVNTNYIGDVLRVVMHSEDASKLEPAADTGLMTLRYVLTEGSPLGSTNVLSLTEIETVDTEGTVFPDSSSSGLLQTGIRGDVSLDGKVSISDVVKNVRPIIGLDAMPDSGTTAFKIADANADHRIDVTDVIRQINTILRIPFTRSLAVSSGPVTVSLGDTRIGPDGRQLVPVLLGGGSMISGVQMTFTYDPSLMSVGEVVKTEYDGGLIWQRHAADGVYTLVGYSLEPGKGLSASGPSFYLPVSITGEDAEISVLTLTDVQLVDRSAYGLDVTLDGVATTVNREVALPATYTLSAATPNPFNPSTTIAYEVPEQTHITLTVYNLLGQEVVRLVDQVQAAGRYEAVWNGTNITGTVVSSGIYLYRIISDSGYTETKRMTLLK